MIFGWVKRRRRQKLLLQPFPFVWAEIITRNFRLAQRLTDEERKHLHADVQVFVAEKNWEGCGGLQLTEEMQVTIAAQACYLLLGLDISWWDHVLTVLVYPGAFLAPEKLPLSGGHWIETQEDRLGEAWRRGPVILAWDEVLAGGRGETEGRNLVFHEFAHQLDMLGGQTMDGIPPLPNRAAYLRWEQVVSREYARLCRACDRGESTLLDCYGTKSEAEFFAVVTEAFFMQPVRLRRRHGELYDLLAEFYRQDPAGRVLGSPV